MEPHPTENAQARPQRLNRGQGGQIEQLKEAAVKIRPDLYASQRVAAKAPKIPDGAPLNPMAPSKMKKRKVSQICFISEPLMMRFVKKKEKPAQREEPAPEMPVYLVPPGTEPSLHLANGGRFGFSANHDGTHLPPVHAPLSSNEMIDPQLSSYQNMPRQRKASKPGAALKRFYEPEDQDGDKDRDEGGDEDGDEDEDEDGDEDGDENQGEGVDEIDEVSSGEDERAAMYFLKHGKKTLNVKKRKLADDNGDSVS
jgi:hypothetical protein